MTFPASKAAVLAIALLLYPAIGSGHPVSPDARSFTRLALTGQNHHELIRDAADQLYNISGARQVSLTHDPRGNVTSITEGGRRRTLTWDSAGRLITTTSTPSSPQSTATTVASSFDYADDYRLTLMNDGVNDAIIPVWGLDNMLAEIAADGTETFTLHLPELDSPIERGPPNNPSGRETLLTDHLMSAIAAYDDAGAVIPGSEVEYAAYGRVRSGSDNRTIGFHGARRLGSTGLYTLRNRVYSPELGRFLSRDPIGFAGGFNLYSYAHNSPISRRDPSGLYDYRYDPILTPDQRRQIERQQWLQTLDEERLLAPSHDYNMVPDIIGTAAGQVVGEVLLGGGPMLGRTSRGLVGAGLDVAGAALSSAGSALTRALVESAWKAPIIPGMGPGAMGFREIGRKMGERILTPFKLGECEGAANAFRQALVDYGLEGNLLEMRLLVGDFAEATSGRFANQTITRNGRHVAVEFGGMVYDNLFPQGLPRAVWELQFATRRGFNITPTPFAP